MIAPWRFATWKHVDLDVPARFNATGPSNSLLAADAILGAYSKNAARHRDETARPPARLERGSAVASRPARPEGYTRMEIE